MADSSSKLGEIFSIIPQLIAEVGAITKDNYNQQQKFYYRGIDALYAALHPLLAKHKVFVTTEVLEQQFETLKSQSGGNLLYARGKIRFRVYASDGSFVESVIPQEAMDSGDKATGKMLSNAYKYFWFHLLCIPTTELPDGESDSPQPGNPPPARAPASPATEKTAGNAEPKSDTNKAPPCPQCNGTATGWSSKAGSVFCRDCKKTIPVNQPAPQMSQDNSKFEEKPNF